MRFKNFDKVLAITVFALIVFGVVMITSIGVPKSIELSAPGVAFPNCLSSEVDCYLLLKKHLMRLGVALLALIACYKINYRIWKRLSLPLFILAFLTLLAVLAFGSDNNTFSTSWFNVYNNSIQPSEFAKLALIFYLANWMEKKNEKIASFKYGFLPFCIVSSLIIFPVMIQPDLGSALVFLCIAVSVFFAAGARIRDLSLGLLVGICISIVLFSVSTRLNERMKGFLHDDQTCTESYCWQSEQAKIAVGSGGFWGQGLTQGIQKSYWLPQASDDFIFAASAEELGFIRIFLVIIAYFIIAYQGFHIALYAPNRFSQLLAVGITTWITAQAFINIAVNIALFPITGVTLPLLSYGGSSLVATLIGIGILLNISKYLSGYAHSVNRRGNRRSSLPQHRYSRRSL